MLPYTDRKYFNKNRYLISAIALALIFSGCSKEEIVEKKEVAVPLKVFKVEKKDLPRIVDFVGQTKGSVDAEIRARVEGILQKITFEEGKPVKEGQLLYEIDPAPFNAKVAEAKGKLAEAQSLYVKSVADLKRIRPLAEMKAVSERDLDKAVAMESSSKASVDAAKAAVEAAEIELSYCSVKAPISGTIGLTKAKVGEFVGKPPNPVVLNTVSNMDPINVRFSVAEKDYLIVARNRVKDKGAEPSDGARKLKMLFSDGQEYPQEGHVVSIDSQIDSATGTLAVEASFPNPDKLIRPGQFAKIRAVLETKKDALVVPKNSIFDLQGQSRVYVVSNDSRLKAVPVTVDGESGDLSIISAGLNEGDSVAAENIQKLKPEMLVVAKN